MNKKGVLLLVALLLFLWAMANIFWLGPLERQAEESHARVEKLARDDGIFRDDGSIVVVGKE